ncbi:MAG: 50S ribosomal protein L24 [Lentisphaerae bacterium]|jgi:large subunit ribosomal protein L24|nr:50S ribosomal protein L24 [Lentisphaerota bacterium]
MSVQRIKKGDIVFCNTGKDAGRTGEVLSIDIAKGYAVVDGLNLKKKTFRKSEHFPEGAIHEIPAPIHLSNLMPYDPESKKGVRISRIREDGKSIRVAKGSGHRFE